MGRQFLVVCRRGDEGSWLNGEIGYIFQDGECKCDKMFRNFIDDRYIEKENDIKFKFEKLYVWVVLKYRQYVVFQILMKIKFEV